MIRVGVIGATGFMGAELVRILLNHSQVQLTFLGGNSTAGKQLAEIRPAFAGLDLPIQAVDIKKIADQTETIFLALPHGDSAAVAEPLLAKGKTIIDLGSDFRLTNPTDVKKFYNREAPSQALLDQAIYCLPELTGPPPSDAKLIACPGCFATALNLTVAALSSLTSELQVFGITGSSGSGISPSAGVHHSLRSTNFTAYKSLTHQHLGEVNQLQRQLQNVVNIQFVPHSAPVVRGIHLTTLVPTSPAVVHDALVEKYKNCAGIQVQEGSVALGSVLHTNRVQFGFSGTNESTAVFCAIDNLLKGGSGQAVQIFNLLNNFPEFEALPMIAPWP